MANVVSSFPYAMDVNGGSNPYAVVIGSSEYDSIEDVDILCNPNSTNHNAEFQLALDTAKNGVVYIRPGNYKLDGTQINKVKGDFTYGMRLIGESVSTVSITCTSNPPLWSSTTTDDGACIFSPSGPVTIKNIRFLMSGSFGRGGLMLLISDSQYKEELHLIENCMFDTTGAQAAGTTTYNALVKIGARIKNVFLVNNTWIGANFSDVTNTYRSPIWIGQPSVTDKGWLGYVPKNIMVMGNKFYGFWAVAFYIFRFYGVILYNNEFANNPLYGDDGSNTSSAGLSLQLGNGILSSPGSWPGISLNNDDLNKVASSPFGLMMIDCNTKKTNRGNPINYSPSDNGSWDSDGHGLIVTKNYFESGNTVSTDPINNNIPVNVGNATTIFCNNHVRVLGPKPISGSAGEVIPITAMISSGDSSTVSTNNPMIVMGNVMERDTMSNTTIIPTDSYLCSGGNIYGSLFTGIVANNASYTSSVRRPATTNNGYINTNNLVNTTNF